MDGMSTHHGAPLGRVHYEIRLQGHLEDRWAASFAGLTLTRAPDGTTLLAGEVVDQAALHGLLRKIRDLGVPLLSISRVGSSTAAPPRQEERP